MNRASTKLFYFLFWSVIGLFLNGLEVSFAKSIITNELNIPVAPAWLTKTRVEKITDRIQDKLEWSTRKVSIAWYENLEAYEKAHSLGSGAMAVTKYEGQQASIHLGPKVSNENFDEILAHELVHVIIFQKYRGAIPKWLEEGLANHLARRGKVDYKWLSQQPFPNDVQELAHPFKGSADGIGYRYKASQALAEMLHKKCDLSNLIRLSVDRKMEDYILTYCEIKDINKAFREWVLKRAGEKF